MEGQCGGAYLRREQKGQAVQPSSSPGLAEGGGPEWCTYHTLAPGADAVGVPVAASRPIVYHLVHEDHVPCVL